MKALAEKPALFNVGTLVRHAAKTVVETAMITGPIIFHNAGPNGDMQREIAYRVVSLEDMKLGYAKNILEVLLEAPTRPWVPAQIVPWTPPNEMRTCLEQLATCNCFLKNEELSELVIRAGFKPQTKRDDLIQQLSSWAAASCLDFIRP